jgi:CRISPR-associated protein Csm3
MDIPTLKGKLILSGCITTDTGLHIGGLSETLKIGGVDIQVIKDSLGRAYIPGSSLKGKIRSLLEISKEDNYDVHIKLKKEGEKKEVKIYNKYNKETKKIERKMKIKSENKDKDWSKINEENFDISKINKLENDGYVVESVSSTPCGCGGCDICKIFGPHNSKNIIYPRRAIVRDAFLVNEKKDEVLTKKDDNYDEYFEVKMENIIDRVKGTAQHPRQIERIVKGSKFKFEVIFNIFDENEDLELVKKFIKGMELLEDDYLGGCGSRGYGKVKFENLNVVYRPKKYYAEENEENRINLERKIELNEGEKKFNKLKEEIGNIFNDK